MIVWILINSQDNYKENFESFFNKITLSKDLFIIKYQLSIYKVNFNID